MVRTYNPKPANNYGTNYRMLKYRLICKHLFVNTFFATNKSGIYYGGHTCCQLFVTYFGFVYLVSIRSKREILQSVKQFFKEIGAPDAIIINVTGE